MSDRDSGLYGRSFADVYDEWYGDPTEPGHVLDAIARRCRAGSTIVEFGSGTGRLLHPLSLAGFTTIGLDVSAAMLSRAPPATKPIVSDMSRTSLRADFADVVLIAYNTLFNLSTTPQQRACLAEASRVLRPSGLLALDNFIPPTSAAGPEVDVSTRPHPAVPDGVVAILTELDQAADGSTTIVGTHVELLPDGVFTRPWRLCCQAPFELDALAASVGLTLVDRLADWPGRPYDPHGDKHVSWYRLDR